MKDSKLCEEGFTRLLKFVDIELPQRIVSDIIHLWGSEGIPFPLDLIKELGKGKQFTLHVQCTYCRAPVAPDGDRCPWCESTQIERHIIILDGDAGFRINCRAKIHRAGANGEESR